MNKTLLAADAVIGTIQRPDALNSLGDVGGGLGNLLNIILNILIVAGGIYSLFNFVFAGYQFLSANGDAQKVQQAWAKIYNTLIGLLFIAGSLVIAAIAGQLIFGDAAAILNPTLPTVGSGGDGGGGTSTYNGG